MAFALAGEWQLDGEAGAAEGAFLVDDAALHGTDQLVDDVESEAGGSLPGCGAGAEAGEFKEHGVELIILDARALVLDAEFTGLAARHDFDADIRPFRGKFDGIGDEVFQTATQRAVFAEDDDVFFREVKIEVEVLAADVLLEALEGSDGV